MQIYVKVLEKQKKKKFLGIIPIRRRKRTTEEIKEETSEEFCFHSFNNAHYLSFLQKHTEEAYESNSECTISLHPRNLQYLYKSSNKSIVGRSTRVKTFILHPSCELFMEFGISNNNNIILPLIDTIIENNLEN